MRWPLDEDELLATATNDETTEATCLETGERVEIRLGQRSQRHREHVELAGLDEREEQRQRTVEGLEPTRVAVSGRRASAKRIVGVPGGPADSIEC
jgi:hypothetical protein